MTSFLSSITDFFHLNFQNIGRLKYKKLPFEGQLLEAKFFSMRLLLNLA